MFRNFKIAVALTVFASATCWASGEKLYQNILLKKPAAGYLEVYDFVLAKTPLKPTILHRKQIRIRVNKFRQLKSLNTGKDLLSLSKAVQTKTKRRREPVLITDTKRKTRKQTQPLKTTVFFDFDSAKLKEKEKEKLLKFANNAKGKTVDVSGYTCWIGPEWHNKKLSERRAKAVASFLSSHGVKIGTVKGYGECCFIDKKVAARNRRSEVVVVHEEKPRGKEVDE
ncbi:MAG TPA: OmpA family protein [Candidatus Aenigmarchaeota archaeon]|nr:OmpA family protein [Candidatus Aenigmarchaeota archaeon]